MIDPSIFIESFCQKLDFGDKTKQVRDTAIRLIQSMDRSWMRTGRRPNGLCGAAILISAKIHNCQRSSAQIVKAVRVGEETLRKRLNEFKTTNTARLTRGKLLEIESEQKDPTKFVIDEKPFEVPKVCKTEILKQLMPESQNVDDDLGEVRRMMEKQAPKFDSKIKKEESNGPEDLYDSDNEGSEVDQ